MTRGGNDKKSVLLLYEHVFATPKFENMTWILIRLIIGWIIAFILALNVYVFPFAMRRASYSAVVLVSCMPIASQWDLNIEPSFNLRQPGGTLRHRLSDRYRH